MSAWRDLQGEDQTSEMNAELTAKRDKLRALPPEKWLGEAEWRTDATNVAVLLHDGNIGFVVLEPPVSWRHLMVHLALSQKSIMVGWMPVGE